jgi:hypothetical protein
MPLSVMFGERMVVGLIDALDRDHPRLGSTIAELRGLLVDLRLVLAAAGCVGSP